MGDIYITKTRGTYWVSPLKNVPFLSLKCDINYSPDWRRWYGCYHLSICGRFQGNCISHNQMWIPVKFNQRNQLGLQALYQPSWSIVVFLFPIDPVIQFMEFPKLFFLAELNMLSLARESGGLEVTATMAIWSRLLDILLTGESIIH